MNKVKVKVKLKVNSSCKGTVNSFLLEVGEGCDLRKLYNPLVTW